MHVLYLNKTVQALCIYLVGMLLVSASVFADTRYVNIANPTPLAPYSNWSTAATGIQDAVDAAASGDTVLVADGVYDAGSTATPGYDCMNRVVITNNITVQSINGPENTFIVGSKSTGGGTGSDAVRGIYMSTGTLSGFTITNGHTRISGHSDYDRSGGGVCMYSGDGNVMNCVISGNAASQGGGGSSYGTLDHCTLSGNSTDNLGGGSYSGVLNNCILSENSAKSGGGGAGSILNNCLLTGNSAEGGGGNYHGTLNNCTIIDNSASVYAGGSAYGTRNNCIVYFNTVFGSTPNWYGGTFNYSCTTPLPSSGSGNINDVPSLVSVSHISANSLCAGTGSSAYTSGIDIDGDAWNSPPSMGCDEPRAPFSGQLSVAIEVGNTVVSTDTILDFSAQIVGEPSSNRWIFGDGTTLSNTVFASHAWSNSGIYQVVLTAWNDSHPAGVSATVQVQAFPGNIHYVDGANPSPEFPYTNWATAAVTIQDAIDATVGGETVLVTNGIYDAGGAVTPGNSSMNRVVITDNMVVQSVNGPESTFIVGEGPLGSSAVRGVYISAGILSGFTVTNGHTAATGDRDYDRVGGGVNLFGGDGLVSNCVLTGNSAHFGGGGSSYGTLERCILFDNSGAAGGGCFSSRMYNCILSGNSASEGGGSSSSTLNNCTLSGNSAFSGGGSAYGILNNCIVYHNTTSSGSNINYFAGSFSYSCTTPQPAGTNNVTNAPLFVDAASGNYRLTPSSPCIDEGINQDWMFDSADMEGNPRILNGTVDIGAYETPFTLNVRALLQGPYDPNSHMMAPPDVAANIPLTSPYATDPRTAAEIPANVVDWVIIELVDADNKTVVSKSAFLNTEGHLLSANGAYGITAEVSTGYYSITVKHRNHLAVMSAQPVAFTNILTAYDLTTGSGQYSGGTNGAVELEPGVWGMVAGDADGDGKIQDIDLDIYAHLDGKNGYFRADFNLDGIVGSVDLTIWNTNQSRISGAENPGTPLGDRLSIVPGRKTLKAGEMLTLTASGTATPAQWGFAENSSGGTLTPHSPSSTVYSAGSSTTGVDVVQVWNGNKLGRAYVNVISTEDTLRAGKAIIIAGHKSLDDPLWPVTDYLANQTYNTLLYRGFDKGNMQYLSPVTDQDVDGNGSDDDIAGSTTMDQISNTFTNWAMANPDQLFIYLVDHGGTSSGDGYFRLNKSEVLMATELDAWLDGIQNQYSNDVTVVLDCCESGSFLEPLAHTGPGTRTVITSCATNEPTYFIAGGLVSFSDAFFSGIFMGLDMEDSFALARDAMGTYQSSWIDADGDGAYDPVTDPSLMAGNYLGPTFVAGKDIPQIGHVLGNQVLYGENDASLWAYDIVSEYPIDRVWSAVVPPGHNPDPADPVADLPLLKLDYNEDSGRYEAQYNGFNNEGVYKLMYYAEDIWGSVSTPKQSFVIQAGYNEGIIIVAGGNTNSTRWHSIDNMARNAYATMAARNFNSNTIHYLSADLYVDADGDGDPDVDDVPSLTSLMYAITNWAAGMDKLTVYLASEAYTNGCRLNATETLTPEVLDGWLDGFQASNQAVNIILDFDKCGTFLPFLTSPPGGERIIIASTSGNSTAMMDPDGLLSFSQCFFSQIFEGNTIGDAYTAAKRSIRLASGRLRQQSILDDNGDGSSSKTDGTLAGERYIGPAFVTGADVPFIGTTMRDTVHTPGNLLLWVSDVSDVDGISNVWCLVTPPDYDGTNGVFELTLTSAATPGRYETTSSNFSMRGTYALTFFAMDNVGKISAPAQTVVVTIDEYENDNSSATATPLQYGQPQLHNLHSPTDEDWVKFFARPDALYAIEAWPLGINSDLVLDVFYESWDGTLTEVAEYLSNINIEGPGSERPEWVDVDLAADTNLAMGTYHIRVSSADTNLWGFGSDYELVMHDDTGGGHLVVVAVDKVAGVPPQGAVAIIDGTITQSFGNVVNLNITNLTEGVHTIEVPPVPGYMTEMDPNTPDSISDVHSFWYGNPKQIDVVDEQWRQAVFQFVPMIRVQGRLRDGMTGGLIAGATLEFNGLVPPLTNTVDGFPDNATYEERWFTQADGRFPTNTWLIRSDWDLQLTHNGYSNSFAGSTLTNTIAGDVIDLGDLYINPMDGNTNGIADQWEIANRVTNPGIDSDGDQLDNYGEYLAGTDPGDPDSRLALTGTDIAASNGFTLHWSSVPGRSYGVESQPGLITDEWIQASPTQEASAAQTQMYWIDPSPMASNKFYRIKLITP